jgi:enoyl-[acyl-carrier protein] reductase III
MTLEGKTAVVTGGTRGIGRAISEKLATLGARVAAMYLRNRRAADETARQFREQGRELRLIRGNVGDAAAVDRAVAEVGEAFGGLDILVCNAALGVLRPVLELDLKSWNWTAERNVGAFLNLVRAAVPLMAGRDGRIVAITSWGAHRVLPNYGAMGAAKAALEAMARHLVPELEPKGITVNLVCPGVVETDALKSFPDPDGLIRRAREQTPGGRLAIPEEVADVVSLLCLPEARRIQGQTIVVDGGASLMA